MDEAVAFPVVSFGAFTLCGHTLVFLPDRGQPRNMHSNPTSVPLYGLFTMTGVGTALLGATLPVMLVHWRLTDGSAGLLFLLLFVASSAGSLASRAASAVRVGGAGLALALCCGGLAVAHGGWAVFPLTAGYGFGLGFSISTVTRVRLLCPPVQRLHEVNRLNFVWGLGAFLCPTLANELIRHGGVRALFFTLAAVFAVGGVWTLACVFSSREESNETAPPAGTDEDGDRAALPWLAAAGAFLTVGLESSLGAWLATYAHRLESGFAAPVEATTLFWLGLLASRALCSTSVVRGFTDRQLLLICLSLTAGGCVALIAVQRGDLVLGSALATGFGIGPVFPMLLAGVLPRVRGNLIFVIAGMGASTLPWVTGALSGHFGSLRVGLVATAMAGVALLAMGSRLASRLERLAMHSPRFEENGS